METSWKIFRKVKKIFNVGLKLKVIVKMSGKLWKNFKKRENFEKVFETFCGTHGTTIVIWS